MRSSPTSRTDLFNLLLLYNSSLRHHNPQRHSKDQTLLDFICRTERTESQYGLRDIALTLSRQVLTLSPRPFHRRLTGGVIPTRCISISWNICRIPPEKKITCRVGFKANGTSWQHIHLSGDYIGDIT